MGQATCTQQPPSAGHEESSAASLLHEGTQGWSAVRNPTSRHFCHQVAAAYPAGMGSLIAAAAQAAAAASSAAPAAVAASQPLRASPAAMQNFPLKPSSSENSASEAAPAAVQAGPDVAGRPHDAPEALDGCSHAEHDAELPNFQEHISRLLEVAYPGLDRNAPLEHFAATSVEMGLPCLLACQGPLTPPDPDTGSSPFNTHGSFSALPSLALILWNPGNNSALWTHPDVHLCRQYLAENVHRYGSAGVLIEEACEKSDNDRDPADPCLHHSLLADLDIEGLPGFAVAALNDIMAHQARDNAESQKRHAAASEGKRGPMAGWQIPEAAPKIWSRRLVHQSRLDPDCLPGSVQLQTQLPAARNSDGLHHVLIRHIDSASMLKVSAGSSGQARQSEVPSADDQPMSRQQLATWPTSQQPALATRSDSLTQKGNPKSTRGQTGSVADSKPSNSCAMPPQAASPSNAAYL